MQAVGPRQLQIDDDDDDDDDDILTILDSGSIFYSGSLTQWVKMSQIDTDSSWWRWWWRR